MTVAAAVAASEHDSGVGLKRAWHITQRDGTLHVPRTPTVDAYPVEVRKSLMELTEESAHDLMFRSLPQGEDR